MSSICLSSIKQAPDYVFAIIILIYHTLSYCTSIIQLPVSSCFCFPPVISRHRLFLVTTLITAISKSILLLKVAFTHFWPLGDHETSITTALTYYLIMLWQKCWQQASTTMAKYVKVQYQRWPLDAGSN